MDFRDFIAPELLVLIPVLWVLGKLIKTTQFIPDRFIPVILGGVSVVISLCYIVGTASSTWTAIFTAITQGILCAGAAVYGNQLVKQAKKGINGEDGDDNE